MDELDGSKIAISLESTVTLSIILMDKIELSDDVLYMFSKIKAEAGLQYQLTIISQFANQMQKIIRRSSLNSGFLYTFSLSKCDLDPN